MKDPGFSRDPRDLAPSGVLALEIGNWWDSGSMKDGKHAQLEDRLNECVIKLLERAFDEKRHREERERREAERREQERLRAIEEEKRRAEEKKIAQWDAWMKNWRRAREVRAFARAIRRSVGDVKEGSDVAAWLVWAEEYAAKIDPIRQ